MQVFTFLNLQLKFHLVKGISAFNQLHQPLQNHHFSK